MYIEQECLFIQTTAYLKVSNLKKTCINNMKDSYAVCDIEICNRCYFVD